MEVLPGPALLTPAEHRKNKPIPSLVLLHILLLFIADLLQVDIYIYKHLYF